MKIEFPHPRYGGDWDKIYHRYYNGRIIKERDMHFPYILNVFKYGGAEVSFFDPEKGKNWKYIKELKSRNKFEVLINNKVILIDLSDYRRESKTTLSFMDKFDAVFVVHWFDELHGQFNNVYPLCPVNFTNWKLFEDLRSRITYTPEPDKLVLNNQRHTKASKGRRTKARELILSQYRKQCDIGHHDQQTFFMNINKALVSVHVPGCRRDILDRGQVQMVGLGMCTISPLLDETFAWNKKIEEWVHYIPCEQMLDDLIDKIEWCKNNVSKCKEIGDNAKNLFDECMHPRRLVEWISACTK